MKKIYKITGCTTDVHEDSYKDGELGFCNQWSMTDNYMGLFCKEYDSLKDLLIEVGDKYLILPYKQDEKKIEEYWFHYEDPDLKDEIRFDNDCMVDGDSLATNDHDIELWKEGKKKLYNAHTVLYVKAFMVEDVPLADMEKDVEELKLQLI